MNFFLAGRALEYYLFSKHRHGHGIHSPYVFNLFSDLTENKPDPTIVKSIEKARKHFFSNKSLINISDLGSGSLKMGGGERRVSHLAAYSSTRSKYLKILSGLSCECRGKPILELGTSLGIGTLAMALAAPDSLVTTIEGCPEISELARASFKRAGADNINLINGDIDRVLGPILEQSGSPALVFIDANHTKEALIRYFDLITDHIDNETVVVIDDIHLSPSMEEGWNRILRSPQVRVTIDILQMGLVFFRRELTRQDYVIRY